MVSALWSQFEGQSIENSFRLTRLIGVGGFGGVFLGDHVVEGHFVRTVAIKLIESQPESFQRQLGELITATTLQHPHLLRCFHAGSVTFGQAKLLYLVMEIAEESLEARLEKSRLIAHEGIVLTQDIASALAFLHQQKLVHRDLKPGNILRVGEVWKLSDFGTVRQSAGAGTSHTRGFTGTICYMPPESFEGTVSPAWDMWSLGALVLEALTGRTPFGDMTEHQLMRAIFTESPTIPPDLPEPFGEIVRGCLTKDYRERWSARQVIESLRRNWHAEEAARPATDRQALQANLPTRERRTEPLQPASATVYETPQIPEIVPDPPSGDSQVPPVVKRRNWTWMVALAAIVVVAAGVWIMMAGRPGPKWASTGPASTGSTRVNLTDGLTYVWIGPGTFTMGCSPDDTECADQEKPAHQVTITKGFWIGRTEVTQAAYERVIGSNPSYFKGVSLPVETISWDKARAYCAAAGMRLPTEAEWEYAARGGNPSARHGSLDALGWYTGNSGQQTHEVGLKQPNAYGVYDTLGNVSEWVADWLNDYGPNPVNDPKGPSSGRYRTTRGGSWGLPPFEERASTRGRLEPGSGYKGLGVRCAGD